MNRTALHWSIMNGGKFMTPIDTAKPKVLTGLKLPGGGGPEARRPSRIDQFLKKVLPSTQN